MPKTSFIQNVNAIAEKLPIIVEANSIFDEGVIPVLEDIAALDLSEAIVDLKKGTFFGNRKIDIDLALNKQGITEGMSTVDALAVWDTTATTVYYSSATVTFVDGHIIEVPFVNDDAQPINISNHGTLVSQLNSNTAFTTYLTETGIFDDIGGATGVLVRMYDIVGQTSNIERIQLHAVSGAYVDQNPIYFWGKTTSAFQTLSMRTADIIKLGNDIDSIIALANRITEMLLLQDKIPELVTNPDSLYANISKLVALHAQIAAMVSIYNDIKTGGTNYINTAGADLLLVDSKIKKLADDLQLGANSKISIVKSNIVNVNTVANAIANVNTVAGNIANVNTVAAQNTNINTLIANLTAIQNASANAATATAQAEIATTKANEIKNVSVASTTTGAAGTAASVVYNPTTGKFSFVVPQGVKGDKGDAFNVNSVGLFAGRSLYDAQVAGFSFLAIDQALIYFKLSATSGDWSIGAPFGKGDKGDPGDTGVGIVDIVFESTTHASGLAAQSGGVDTYTITFTDASTSVFLVRNGLDSDVFMSDLTALADAVNTALGDKADKSTTYTKTEVNDLLLTSSNQILKPSITSPATGAIDFIGAVTSSAYTTGTNYQGIHDYTHWQCATDTAFTAIIDEETVGNLTSWTPSVGLALTTVYVRVRYGSDNHLSEWSDTISFTTPNIYINTPTLTVTGTPTDVPETPTLTTSAFSVANGADTHASTDWQVIRVSDSTIIWQSLSDATNKLTITVPAGVLAVSTAYTFKARHNGATYGSSAYVSVSGTTKSAFIIPIGTAGAMDFGVAPSSEAWAVMGLSEMTGTTTAGHDNYGNYQHTNGSIMVHVPKFYYRIGNAAAPQYATYGANSIEIKGTESYTTEAAANAAGFVLHRAFIDGGVEKGGFFIDKYMASKKVGDTNVAVSVKNGNPIGLTTNTTYTPSSTMTGCTGILADAITLSRARGSYFNAASAFMYGAIALLSIAHAQRATGTAACAWYDASLTTNFPKGCNNGSLSDVNDTSVTWSASPDTAAKGLTGSASNFAKSTHNGQNNGIADVNGLMYEVGIGITNFGTSATSTTQITTNTIYVLKQSVALKNLTAGWDGATDAWGNTTNLSTRYDAVTSPITVSASTTEYWGSGSNQVFDPASSGVGRDLCGVLPKNDASDDATGTNMCGNDYIRHYNVQNMQPLFCGYWSTAAFAGVLYRNLVNYRCNDNLYAGFRAAAYV